LLHIHFCDVNDLVLIHRTGFFACEAFPKSLGEIAMPPNNTIPLRLSRFLVGVISPARPQETINEAARTINNIVRVGDDTLTVDNLSQQVSQEV